MTTMMAITTTNTTNTNTLTHHVETCPPPLNTVVPNSTMMVMMGLEMCMFFFLLLLTFIYFRLHMMTATTMPSCHITHLSPHHLDHNHHHHPLGRCSSSSGDGRSSRSSRRGRAAGATNINRTWDASASRALVCFYFILNILFTLLTIIYRLTTYTHHHERDKGRNNNKPQVCSFCFKYILLIIIFT